MESFWRHASRTAQKCCNEEDKLHSSSLPVHYEHSYNHRPQPYNICSRISSQPVISNRNCVDSSIVVPPNPILVPVGSWRFKIWNSLIWQSNIGRYRHWLIWRTRTCEGSAEAKKWRRKKHNRSLFTEKGEREENRWKIFSVHIKKTKTCDKSCLNIQSDETQEITNIP